MPRVNQVMVTQVDGEQVEEIAHDAKSGVRLVKSGSKSYVIQGAHVLIECQIRSNGLFKSPTVEGEAR